MSESNRDNVVNSVVGFIEEYFSVDKSKAKVSSTTDIVYEFGVAGDDGDDFILAFATRFQIPLEALKVEWKDKDFFGSESPTLYDFWQVLRLKRERPLDTLRVCDLADCVVKYGSITEK